MTGEPERLAAKPNVPYWPFWVLVAISVALAVAELVSGEEAYVLGSMISLAAAPSYHAGYIQARLSHMEKLLIKLLEPHLKSTGQKPSA